MTVATGYQPNAYKPGAAMAARAIGWAFLSAADVVVTHTAAASGLDTVLVPGTDYEIAGNGPAGTATIRALAAWPTDDVFTVTRVTPRRQSARIRAGMPLPAEELERQLDRETLAGQEVGAHAEALFARALVVRPGQSAEPIDLAAFDGKLLAGGPDGFVPVVPGDPFGIDTLASLGQPSGFSLIKHKRAEAGTYARTTAQQERMGMFEGDGHSLLHWVDPALDADLKAGDNMVALTAAVQTAVNAVTAKTYVDGVRRDPVVVPGFELLVADAINLNEGQVLRRLPGGSIRQETIDKPALAATGKNGLDLDVDLFGHGYWDPTWNSSGDHSERGIHLRNCDQLRIRGRVRNFGFAQICLNGCVGIDMDVIVEGTHDYGTPLEFGGNRQFGVYLMHGTEFGPCDDFDIRMRAKKLCQGFLSEFDAGDMPQGSNRVRAIIREIIGQHAFYVTTGHLKIEALLDQIALGGIKLAPGFDKPLENVLIDLLGTDIGGNALEFYTLGSGELRNVYARAVLGRVGRALTLQNRCRKIKADIDLRECNRTDAPYNTGAPLPSLNAVEVGYAKGTGYLSSEPDPEAAGSGYVGPQDCDITIRGENIRLSGVYVYAPNSSVTIRPVLRQVNQAGLVANPGGSGIRTEVNALLEQAKVKVIDPVITDNSGKMAYGLFADSAKGRIDVEGPYEIAGFTSALARADGEITGVERTYTPTVTAATPGATPMSVTVGTNRFLRSGNRVRVDLAATIDAANDSSDVFRITLPYVPARPFSIPCRDSNGNLLLQMSGTNGVAYAEVRKVDGTTAIATGRVIRAQGEYEAVAP